MIFHSQTEINRRSKLDMLSPYQGSLIFPRLKDKAVFLEGMWRECWVGRINCAINSYVDNLILNLIVMSIKCYLHKEMIFIVCFITLCCVIYNLMKIRRP